MEIEHVSQWPTYDLPETEELRPLAIWDESIQSIIIQDGEVIPFQEIGSFIKTITNLRLIIFTDKVLSISILDQLLKDNRCKFCVSRTGGFFAILIKSRRSAWIVQRSVWDGGTEIPNKIFIDSIQNVFDITKRSAATPGALGEKKIRETLARGTRYNRPSTMLRAVLLDNRIGGRADLFDGKRNYNTLYENDINSAYIYTSQETIDPAESPKRFWGEPTEFFSYYARIRFKLDATRNVKFGPLAIRSSDGRLDFITKTNEWFEGWYWKEEIERARNSGYTVEIIDGYLWRKSSNWLQSWAQEMHRLKESTSGEVRQIIKKMGVAAIGRFGRSPERLSLVHSMNKKEGKTYIPVIDSFAGPNEPSITDYFICIEKDEDNNSLTHIGSYIVMKCRCELYDRCIQEEQLGNIVIMTNYDAYYVLKQSQLKKGKNMGQWKETLIEDAIIYGSRSISGKKKGTPFEKRPGVPRKKKVPG